MRVLQIVKTPDGARWAAWQARALTRLGLEVHVAVPSATGAAMEAWEQAGARIHVCDLSLPVGRPHLVRLRAEEVRRLVSAIKPDLVHNHFVTTAMMTRLALGRCHRVPRVFQVPGPLHLEHPLYRFAEIATAGVSDHWIATSRYTRELYLRRGGLPAHRVHLSYYGIRLGEYAEGPTGELRARLDLGSHRRIVGNISYMYAPKYYLGQLTGLKRHEDIIDALAIVCRKRSDVTGVLLGKQWGRGKSYERRLARRAASAAGASILLPGHVAQEKTGSLWADFDCAVHVPVSENCGGVVEPLAYGVPIVASRVGGLPEVVLDGVTGWMVQPDDPAGLAETILEVLANPSEARRRARLGRELVRTMFDVDRAALEIAQIYQAVVDGRSPAPPPFSSAVFVADVQERTQNSPDQRG